MIKNPKTAPLKAVFAHLGRFSLLIKCKSPAKPISKPIITRLYHRPINRISLPVHPPTLPLAPKMQKMPNIAPNNVEIPILFKFIIMISKLTHYLNSRSIKYDVLIIKEKLKFQLIKMLMEWTVVKASSKASFSNLSGIRSSFMEIFWT